MISLTCTSCRVVLEMDVGFAGGVCRCQHCGTIQTVPAHLKANSGSTKKVGRSLYSKSSSRDEGIPSSGLDQIAQAVASSGLSSGLLRRPSPSKKKAQRAIAWTSAAFGVFLVFFGGVWFSSRQTGQQPIAISAPIRNVSEVASVVPSSETPNFCGSPIKQRTVIYLLDRGSGTEELFSYLKEASIRSAASLGSDHKFQLIFWNNGSDDSFPNASTAFATVSTIEAGRHFLDGIYAHGQSDVASAMTKAVGQLPELIILATGKGGQLSEEFSRQVLQIRGDHPIRIDTFDLGSTELSAPLKAIALATGGEARLINESDLKHAARD